MDWAGREGGGLTWWFRGLGGRRDFLSGGEGEKAGNIEHTFATLILLGIWLVQATATERWLQKKILNKKNIWVKIRGPIKIRFTLKVGQKQ